MKLIHSRSSIVKFTSWSAATVCLCVALGCVEGVAARPDAAVPETTASNPPAAGTSAESGAKAGKPLIEYQINDVATSEHTRQEKADELFKMFAKLDGDDQRKVAIAALKQIGDAEYAAARKHLLNAKLNPQVLSVFLTDVLKRKDAVRLPVLLEVARLRGHPMQLEARELLQGLLQKSYGTDWVKWEQAIKTQIASQPK